MLTFKQFILEIYDCGGHQDEEGFVKNTEILSDPIKIPLTKLKTSEDMQLYKKPSSNINIKKLTKHIKSGGELPPILVRKTKNLYQVIDGHHRMLAHKNANMKTINAKVVDDENIHKRLLNKLNKQR